jgi:hypothetical protein
METEFRTWFAGFEIVDLQIWEKHEFVANDGFEPER